MRRVVSSAGLLVVPAGAQQGDRGGEDCGGDESDVLGHALGVPAIAAIEPTYPGQNRTAASPFCSTAALNCSSVGIPGPLNFRPIIRCARAAP